MFSLFCGLWTNVIQKPELYVLMVGLDGAGKTTILEKTKKIYSGFGLEPKQISPTVGLNLAKLNLRGRGITIWDLGGASSLRAIWNRYYSDADALIFVIDGSSSDERMRESVDFFDMAKEGTCSGPILIFISHSDKEQRFSLNAIAEILTKHESDSTSPSSSSPPSRSSETYKDVRIPMHDQRGSRTCRLQQACSITESGLKEGLEWLVSQLVDHESS